MLGARDDVKQRDEETHSYRIQNNTEEEKRKWRSGFVRERIDEMWNALVK